MGIQATAQYHQVMAAAFPVPAQPTYCKPMTRCFREVPVSKNEQDKATAHGLPAEDGRDICAFEKDYDRLNEHLIYDGKSIYEHHKEDFDRLAKADDEVLQHQLKEKVISRLDDYLKRKLGANRLHLIPEIHWRFSQKAATELMTQFIGAAFAKYQGNYANFTNDQQRIVLDISDNPRKRVRVRVSSVVTYRAFFSDDDSLYPKDLPHPMKLKGTAKYKIGRNGNDTVADFDISFKPTRS